MIIVLRVLGVIVGLLNAAVIAAMWALTAVQVHVHRHEPVSGFLLMLANAAFAIAHGGGRAVRPDEYAAVIPVDLSQLVMWQAGLLALAAFVSARLITHEAQERSPMQVKRVKPGVDDLRIMSKHFEGADDVMIYSGDFSWVGLDSTLRQQLIDFVGNGKLKLVSYKPEKAVRSGMGVLHNQLGAGVHFDPDLGEVKWSIVRRGSERKLIFKFVDENKHCVCVVRDKAESGYLLEMLERVSRRLAKA